MTSEKFVAPGPQDGVQGLLGTGDQHLGHFSTLSWCLHVLHVKFIPFHRWYWNSYEFIDIYSIL
jgi:hypothetical protein